MYRFPSASQTYAPRPWTNTISGCTARLTETTPPGMYLRFLFRISADAGYEDTRSGSLLSRVEGEARRPLRSDIGVPPGRPKQRRSLRSDHCESLQKNGCRLCASQAEVGMPFRV